MKVSVLGAGAIGSMIGGLLAHDAEDVEVVLITRGEHARKIADRGTITLEGPWGRREVRVAVSDDPSAVSGSEFVLVTTKSQDTEAAAAAGAPHWGGATIVSIQNGINDARLLKFVEPTRLVMGMTATNMALVEPGRVSLQLGGATIVGPPAGAGAAVGMSASDAAAKLLSRIACPSLQFLAHPNAVGARYNKLAINALGYASCLSRSNFITEALAHRGWRNTVGLPIVRECGRVFEASGIKLERIPGVPSLPRFQRLMRRMNRPLMGPVIAFVLRRLYNRRPIIFSLQRDLERGKTTEVEFVNGEVVRLAESQGGAAPMNRLVVQLVRELEGRGAGSFFSRDEVLARFASLAGRA
ncbi:MAG: ketopantoate reductase family protein [Pirellulales bacterium]